MSKRKADLLVDAKHLYSDTELKHAGIEDSIEYIHEDLTVDEIKEYIHFFKHGDFANKFKEIKHLRSQRPASSWQLEKLAPDLYEFVEMRRLQKELKKLWKHKPKIENRDVESKQS